MEFSKNISSNVEKKTIGLRSFLMIAISNHSNISSSIKNKLSELKTNSFEKKSFIAF